MSAAEVKRNHINTLSLRVSLAYTGGGLIDHFLVDFRHHPEGGMWISLGNITPAVTTDSNMLVWTAQLFDARFQGSRIELRLEAVNSNNHISNQIIQLEEIGKHGNYADHTCS